MLADKPIRVANLLIDLFVISIISSTLEILSFVFEFYLPIGLIGVILIYYFLFEIIWGVTPGKMCTGQ